MKGKTHLYIEISKFIQSSHITGIPRVVIRIIEGILCNNANEFELILLYNERGENKYKIVQKDLFENANYYGDRKKYVTHCEILIDEIESNSIFLDIENSWHSHLKRNYLFPILKKHNVRILCFLHDVIAITHPQFCAEENLLNFPAFLGAHLLYADAIITTTQYNKSQLEWVVERLSITPKKIYVVPLGSDFSLDYDENNVDKKIISNLSGRKYLLTVGTIEPRKNQKVILDAYDYKLKEYDIDIVFAGNIGWSIKEFSERLFNHDDFDTRIFNYQNLNDDSIKYLYKHALFTVFPTYVEGFGLPAVETLQAGTPLLASDIPVLREIAGEYADYFKCDDYEQLCELLADYMQDNAKYLLKKNSITEYRTANWADSVNALVEIINSYIGQEGIDIQVNQMVIMVSNAEVFLQTELFIEKYMRFINNIVIICTETVHKAIVNAYSGTIKLEYIIDNNLLDSCNNKSQIVFCRYISSELLEDTFLLANEYLRPITDITRDIYFDNRFKCYYLKNVRANMLIEEEGIRRTEEFLKNNNIASQHFELKMPQIFYKNWLIDLLKSYPEIIDNEFSICCSYFAFCINNYPECFDLYEEPLIYVAYDRDDNINNDSNSPSSYLFEYFDERNYLPSKVFDGFTMTYSEYSSRDALNKIICYEKIKERGRYIERLTQKCVQKYIDRFGLKPCYVIEQLDGEILIHFPQVIYLDNDETYAELSVCLEKDDKEGIIFEWYLADKSNKPITQYRIICVEESKKITISFPASKLREGLLVVSCRSNRNKKIYIKQVKFETL